MSNVRNADPAPKGPGFFDATPGFGGPGTLSARMERYAPAVFLMPAVLVILSVSIFPLIISLYLSLSRFKFVKGGFEVKYIGLLNYKKLLFGSQQFHFLGDLAEVSTSGWVVLVIVAGVLGAVLFRYARGPGLSALGLFGRGVVAVGALAIVVLFVRTIGGAGNPGTLVVTLTYVFVGVTLQFLLGLGLALLCAQRLPGRRFFRVVFFLPMMITPVGIAYTFRILSDTTKGPLFPLWRLFGWEDQSWVTNAWGARSAVMIGDAWQWIPFMFIVLLAALESQPQDQVEAAMVDGASRWQIFRDVSWPAILPVSITLILIRTIEAFKIVDLPNVLTNGGPGIASESLTLHAYMSWRALDLGGSSAVAYLLMLVAAFVCLSYITLVRPRAAGVA